jgi:hypothetical protein
MLYPMGVSPFNQPVVTLDYDGVGRVIKRTGDVYYTNGMYPYSFTKEVFEDVTYSSNKIVITKNKNSEEFFIYPHKKEVYLQHGNIKLTVTTEVLQSYTGVDSVLYYYSQSRLIRTVERNWRVDKDDKYLAFEFVKDYTFKSDNLERIDGTKTTSIGEVYTTVEKFGGYDDAPNPTKQLQIFNEVFYRSLSKNNFTEYTYEMRDSDNGLLQSQNRYWNLNYGEDGVPTFL